MNTTNSKKKLKGQDRQGGRPRLPEQPKQQKQKQRYKRVPASAMSMLQKNPVAIAQERAMQHILSVEQARNQMAVAQQLPGVFPAKFETDGQIIDTVPIVSTAARTIERCWDGGGQSQLGHLDYTVIMSCSAYTMFHGLGGGGEIPSTSKLAGLGLLQTNDVNTTLTLRQLLTRAEEGTTMDDVYGSQGTQATNSSFIWASRLDFRFLSQKVGATGVIHMGYLPHSSLVTEDGIAGVFSVDDLIKRSITTVDITSAKNCFSLHSALQVKAGIMSAAYENFGDLANTLQGEIVTYAVLNRPFTQFETGLNQAFSLVLQTHANGAGFARSDDSFAPRKYRGEKLGITVGQTDYAALRDAVSSVSRIGIDLNTLPEIGSVSSDPTLNNKLSKLQSQGGKWLRHAFSEISEWIRDNQETIKDYAWDAFKMLPGLLMDQPDSDDLYMDVDYCRAQIRRALTTVSQFQYIPGFADSLSSFESALQVLGHNKGLMPIEKLFPQNPDPVGSVAPAQPQHAHTTNGERVKEGYPPKSGSGHSKKLLA